METNNKFAGITSLIGEPARAIMLWSLADGKAYTASELATAADISPQSASNHLNKLVEADFLKVEKQGKHRYYAIAKPEVAHAIESIANLIPGKKTLREEKNYVNGEIRFCRTCYDHLAGKVAVDLARSLLQQKILTVKGEEFSITPKGKKWFAEIGIDVNNLEKTKRYLAKPCLDWTERKYHLAGSLGAAFLLQMLKMNWIKPKATSRILFLTEKGENELRKIGVKL